MMHAQKKDWQRMLLFTAGLLALLCSVVPVAAVPLNETWSATFGGPFMENGYAVTPSGDGGYVIAGDARSTDSVVSTDAWMIGTTSTGTQVWDRKFGGSRYDSANSVIALPDGYLVAGTTLSFPVSGGQDAWLIRTDSSGTEIWNRTYGGGSTDIFQSVTATTDGGFAAAGLTSSYGSGSGDMYLVKTTADGTEEWHTTFGGAKSDKGMSLHQLSDGGYILAGTTYSLGQNETNVYLVRTDSSGAMVWQKTYGHNRMNFGYDVLVLPDGGFVMAGYTDPYPSSGPRSAYVARTDAQGTLIWENTPGDDRIISDGMSVAATTDGRFVITGGSLGLFLAGLDSDGTVRWENVIARSPNDRGLAIEPASGGGFIVTGSREQPGNNWDVYLMRIDEETVQPVPVPLPGMTNPPTDPDGDGLYEDLSGNGGAGFNDVVLFFKQIDWIAENEPLSAFDFSGNGGIGFQDIVSLFKEL